MKRVLLLLFVLFATMTNASVVTIGGMKYDIRGTKAAIISCFDYYGNYLHDNFNYTGTSYTVPSYITYKGNTYIVDKVAYSAFSGLYADRITSISLPNTINTIGESAFDGTGISKMIIPSSVTTMLGNPFRVCDFLTTLIYLPKSAPSKWTATSTTYVPDKSSYSSPSYSVNGSSIVEYCCPLKLFEHKKIGLKSSFGIQPV